MNNKQNNSDFTPFNDELGSFNIEPPKIYREEQRQRINAEYYNKRDSKSAKKITTKNKSKKQPQQQRHTKRKLKKGVRNALFGLLVLVFTAVLLLVLSLTVLFKIETININGNNKYTTEEIMAVLPIENQANLFLTDTDLASNTLESALPYIYDANITRKLPSTINVQITEASKLYALKDADNTFIIMDDNFKVLEKGVATQPKNSLLIQKATVKSANPGSIIELEDENVLLSIQTVNDMTKSLQIDSITSIYATNKDNNYIVHDGRIVINLGTTDDLENKLYTALASIDKLEQTNPKVEGELNVSSDKQTYFTEKK